MIISIIIPTFQEKENIEPLVVLLELELSKLNHSFNIVVCDDNSPDGTGRVVKSLRSTYKNLFLISGDKKGLGRAIVRGINYAITTLRSETVVTIDADFSHNPAEIGRLLKKIEAGADFVIGSRYVPEGQISAGWSQFRRFVSSWGNRFAQFFVGIYDVSDCTSGFRAIKTTCLKKINLNSINEKGYSFQVRLLYEAKKTGAEIVEVPINFANRRSGSTKLGFWDIIEFIVMTFKISLIRLLRLSR